MTTPLRQVSFAFVALLALALAGGDAWARGGSGGSGGGHGGGRGGHSASGGKSNSGNHRHHNGNYRRGTSSGVFFGTFLGFGAYPYWSQSAYVYPQAPVYYIERSEEELRNASVWFYCEGEAAYYPYVTSCPAGWVKVEPYALPGGQP